MCGGEGFRKARRICGHSWVSVGSSWARMARVVRRVVVAKVAAPRRKEFRSLGGERKGLVGGRGDGGGCEAWACV